LAGFHIMWPLRLRLSKWKLTWLDNFLWKLNVSCHRNINNGSRIVLRIQTDSLSTVNRRRIGNASLTCVDKQKSD
jgi:hypothetical protein